MALVLRIFANLVNVQFPWDIKSNNFDSNWFPPQYPFYITFIKGDFDFFWLWDISQYTICIAEAQQLFILWWRLLLVVCHHSISPFKINAHIFSYLVLDSWLLLSNMGGRTNSTINHMDDVLFWPHIFCIQTLVCWISFI